MPTSPLSPDQMKLYNIEKMLLESVVAEDEVAIRGVAAAYELTLKEIYGERVQ